jgi:hypothetical protein
VSVHHFPARTDERTRGHRQPPPAKPAGDPPGDEEDRDGGDGRPEVEQRHLRRRRVERDAPPPPRLAEGDQHPEPQPRDDRRAGQGPREAPPSRPREEHDSGQCDGVNDGPHDELLCRREPPSPNSGLVWPNSHPQTPRGSQPSGRLPGGAGGACGVGVSRLWSSAPAACARWTAPRCGEADRWKSHGDQSLSCSRASPT